MIGLSVNILCSDGVLEMMFQLLRMMFLMGLMSSQYLVTNVRNFFVGFGFSF